MAYQANDNVISKLLNDVIYLIPRNQRRYVWEQENWKDLYEDVIFSKKNKNPHFLGSILLKQEAPKNGLNHYTIIDGQQRMFTITIFLVAIMLHFKLNRMEDDFQGTIKHLLAKNNRNQNIKILQSDYHISLEKFVDGLSEISEDDIKNFSVDRFTKKYIISDKQDKVIADCLKYYFNLLQEEIMDEANTNGILIEIRDAIVEMSYVNIVATTEEDSYTIFEILNSRGQGLEDHELLKNYIMRYIHPIEERDTVKTIWENIEQILGNYIINFIKHYAPHRYQTNDDMRKQPYRNINRNTKGMNINDLLTDINLKAKYYEKLRFPKRHDNNGNEVCSELEFEIFTFFKSKRQEQFRPIILSLMHQKELGNLNVELYDKALKFIYNFFICYTIIGKEKSNKITEVIYKYAPLLENRFTDELLKEFLESLKARIPSKEWFEKSFGNIGYSKKHRYFRDSKEKAKCQLIIEVLEKFKNPNGICCEFTIEHMLPDNESEENAIIGNLIPLEESLNGRCGDKSLEEKLKIYEESNFYITRRVGARYKTDKFRIMGRTKVISDIFYDEILTFTID